MSSNPKTRNPDTLHLPAGAQPAGPWTDGAYPTFLHPDGPEPACRSAPTDWFFPRGTIPRYARAYALCAVCPLLDDCREWAIAQTWSLHGIWGGTTQHQREAIRRCRTGRCGHGIACPELSMQDPR